MTPWNLSYLSFLKFIRSSTKNVRHIPQFWKSFRLPKSQSFILKGIEHRTFLYILEEFSDWKKQENLLKWQLKFNIYHDWNFSR